MARASRHWGTLVCCVLAAGLLPGQAPPRPAAPLPSAAPPAPLTGGTLHGTIVSGKIPLPGVTVTAQNSLTGKRYATATDINGAWSMSIPLDGRYVVRTEFAGFAQGASQAVLNASGRDRTMDFQLELASRVSQRDQQESASMSRGVGQLANNGPQSLNLVNTLSADTQAAEGGTTASGAALPSAAGNADFAGDSVSINGQSGQVSPLAGVEMDRLRDAMETMRTQNGGNFSGPGGGFFMMGGPGGFGGFGGRRNFRSFNPGQPHGAIFWFGSNSALDALPFSLRGQPQIQPASGTNRFGLTFISAPYIPGLTKPSGKDTLFLTLSGSRSSLPQDQYATVPTAAERSGNIPGLSSPITPVPQALALLNYIPQPNLPGDTQNFHLLTTSQSNTTQAGLRYMRGIGANATPFGSGRRGRRTPTQGLRQSINFNYNWAHSASDDVKIVPILGGKTASDSYSLQAGYTVGYRKFTSIFNANWNRNDAQTTNYFTNGTDIATQLGILGPGGTSLNSSPLNYGVPSVTLSTFTGIGEVQPSFLTQQTISISETLAWRPGKHNFRFGGDYRRVHRDFLGGSNATGTFYFTGYYTGSALGDFLLGEPQETSIASAISKSYLRDNVFDLYAQDDWRARSNLTLLYGLRYEFFAPYNEKYNHLAMVDTNPAGGFTSVGQVAAGSTSPNFGHLPASLVYPFNVALAPRLGMAWRLQHQAVVRAGYGMNYTVSEYASFASAMAYQPPFANEQTNEAATTCPKPSNACFTLANGFPAPNPIGNYAVDPHYRLPYVQVWNVDVQKTFPWGILVNAGYNGSHGSNLDVKIAPRAVASSPSTDPGNVPFFYEEYGAYSRFNSATLRVNKRMSNGVAVGATYQYGHSIDDASSIGGTSTVVAQNWQDIAADEGNSNFDVRHRVNGYYVYELPFGKDKFYFTSGRASHILEGFSVSGSFTFATGTPLTPTLQASVEDVAHGTTGTERPNRVPGTSVMSGGGSLLRWFNPNAFTPPAPDQFGNAFGNAPRNSIPGPGTVSNNMSLSKTVDLGDTRSFEMRATANNVFNTVQYTGVFTTLYTGLGSQQSSNFGQVTQTGRMRWFQFTARFRF